MAIWQVFARFARLRYGNLEAIWQDANLATNGLTSLATQATWQKQLQRSSRLGLHLHRLSMLCSLVARLPDFPDCPIVLFARLARLCSLPDWPDSAQRKTRPTAVCPIATDCIIFPTRTIGLARLLPDCYKAASQ